MKKVLILGINSFSGCTFARYIQDKKFKVFGTYHKKKNDKYILYNKKKVIINKIDNLEEKKLIKFIKKVQPEIIIDFASICMVNESWKYRLYYNQVNYKSKIKLANYLCGAHFLKKYIYISTPEIFGSKKNIYENSKKFNPSTPYAHSKYKAEKLFMELNKKKNFPIIICRFSNFYGPAQPIYRLIPKVCVTLDLNKKFPLHGNGETKRNFIYSEDFSRGLLSSIKKGKIGRVYHFSGKETVSIKKIVETICNKKRKNIHNFLKITPERRQKDQIYFLSTTKTEKELNWKCRVSLEVGLNKTIKFYKRHFNYLKYEEKDYKFIK